MTQGFSIPTSCYQTYSKWEIPLLQSWIKSWNSPWESKSNFSQMQHICQTSPSHVIRNCFLIWANRMSTYPTHTATAKGGRWGEKWMGGWMFFSWRHLLFCLSLHAHLQTLAIWITALGMNHVHIQFLYPHSPIVSHTNLKYVLHTRRVSYLPVCVFVWGDIVLQGSEKDQLPVSNCLSHSTPSLNPPGSTYFLLILAPSLFLLLSMGGFVSYLRHKTLIHSMS